MLIACYLGLLVHRSRVTSEGYAGVAHPLSLTLSPHLRIDSIVTRAGMRKDLDE